MKRTGQWLTAAALLPLVWAATAALIGCITFGTPLTRGEIFFWGGAALCLVSWAADLLPGRMYVFGHEWTHTLWGKIFGARILRVHVGASGGKTCLSKTNIWISLAPYFFPLYAVALCLIFYGASLIFPVIFLKRWFLAGLGFALSYHLLSTTDALRIRQRDLKASGLALGGVVIFGATLLSTLLLLKCAMPWRISILSFIHEMLQRSLHLYQTLWNLLKP